jgi:hypothetical protein
MSSIIIPRSGGAPVVLEAAGLAPALWRARERYKLRVVRALAEWEEGVWPDAMAAVAMSGAPMNAGFSQYAETHLLDHLHGKTAFVMPAGPYLALCTTVPTSASTGSTISEASYTGYTRISLPGANWAASAAGTPSTGATNTTLTGGACTAGSSTVIGWATVDANAAGNMLEWGTCASTLISTTATPPTVAAGALTDSLA